MRVYRPTKSNKLTQKFGENRACAKTNIYGGIRIPTKIVTAKNGVCPIGFKKMYPLLGLKSHNGEDWATWNGEPLYFNVVAESKKNFETKWWSRSEVDSSGGIGVDVFSATRIYLKELPPQAGRLATREWKDNNGWVYVKFRYWHLKEVLIADAKRPTPKDLRPLPNVKLGQMIARCDSTGASSGHHLHWSLKIVAENSMTLDNDNGYMGAVDFSEWYENNFVMDVLRQKSLSQIQDKINEIKKVVENIIKAIARLLSKQ